MRLLYQSYCIIINDIWRYMKKAFFILLSSLLLITISCTNSVDTKKQLATLPMYKANMQRTGYFNVQPIKHTPKEKWRFNAGDNIRDARDFISDAVTYKNKIYFGSPKGLFALNKNTGKLVWKVNKNGKSSQPYYYRGTIFFSTYNGLYALDANNGAIKWFFPNKTDFFPNPTLAVGNTVYFNQNNFYAINIKNGKQEWKLLKNDIFPVSNSSPAYYKGYIYVTIEKSYCLNEKTKKVIWTSNRTGNTQLLSNNTIYSIISYTINDDKLLASDYKTGKEKWGKAFPKYYEDVNYTSPTLKNNMILVKDDSKTIYAFDALNGRKKWKRSLRGNNANDPYIAGDYVYAADYRGLFCLNLNSGKTRWMYDKESIDNILWFDNNKIFAGNIRRVLNLA